MTSESDSRRGTTVADRRRRLAAEVQALPVTDRRPAEEIVGVGTALSDT